MGLWVRAELAMFFTDIGDSGQRSRGWIKLCDVLLYLLE
jgi:hypothetical protein